MLPPPLKAGHDDETDEPLLLRVDDRPVVLPIRLEEFYAEAGLDSCWLSLY